MRVERIDLLKGYVLVDADAIVAIEAFSNGQTDSFVTSSLYVHRRLEIHLSSGQTITIRKEDLPDETDLESLLVKLEWYRP